MLVRKKSACKVCKCYVPAHFGLQSHMRPKSDLKLREIQMIYVFIGNGTDEGWREERLCRTTQNIVSSNIVLCQTRHGSGELPSYKGADSGTKELHRPGFTSDSTLHLGTEASSARIRRAGSSILESDLALKGVRSYHCPSVSMWICGVSVR